MGPGFPGSIFFLLLGRPAGARGDPSSSFSGEPPLVMPKEEHIELEGSIHTVLPGTMFRVELPNKHLVLATICGKMRKRFVRLTVGDRVKMEMSPYDLNKARIVWRLR
jgi:translation initiation factor IF-1